MSTRPRVLEDESGYQWRMAAYDVIEWRVGVGQDWGEKLARGGLSLTITKRRAQIIADLLANPREAVAAQ